MTSEARELQINDLFWTLQGEGRWTGQRALFVRLPFCNYNCPWCDTEYNSFKKWTENEFLVEARREKARFAVITGGEPMAHKDLGRIISLLKQEGFYIACETNGSFPIPELIDFATVSPKRFTQGKHPPYYIHPKAQEKAREFKYVVDDDFDFSILDRHAPSFQKTLSSREQVSQNSLSADLTRTGSSSLFDQNQSVRFSLTPEYSTLKEQLPRILTYIQNNPQWQLNLQSHKWIQIP